MKTEGEGRLLRVFVGEQDHRHGHPLYQAVVAKAREEGLAGATVLRGIEGFGANSVLHTSRLLQLSSDLPIVVEIVDDAERIDAFLPIIEEMVGDGLVTIETVHVIAYRAKSGPER